ncbi:c-type cytochrome [Zunongwangia pacifica]|uniref:Cytochrome c n=1 Tax=Zunongwangia pacifica TaxID=2911062 RepID=A0A9X1ZS07_9FLAO|nr:cytochrome c [Zunongwangia pacifica]MCL6218976.1 cytochrome c [Zunongwangia pacifica]
MKSIVKTGLGVVLALCLASCGNSDKKKDEDGIRLNDYGSPGTEKVEKKSSAKVEVDMSNKGVGPIKSVSISSNIDTEMAKTGSEVFSKMCTACHKMDKKFVGPSLGGVTERRSPEWIMNMILSPEKMIKEDPIAKQLMVVSNMAMMANQGLNEEEARAILEYFREHDKAN